MVAIFFFFSRSVHSGGVWDDRWCCHFVSRACLVCVSWWDNLKNEISISNRNDVKAMTASSANRNFILKFEMFPPKGGTRYFVPARYNSLSVVRVPVAGSWVVIFGCWLRVGPSPPRKSVKLPLRWEPLRGCGQPNQFFMIQAKTFMSGVVKKCLGIEHYWGRVEFASGRGAIHLYMLGIAKDRAYLYDFTRQAQWRTKQLSSISTQEIILTAKIQGHATLRRTE